MVDTLAIGPLVRPADAQRAIRDFLKATGMSQAAFAEWLGHHDDFVGNINRQELINTGTEKTVFRFIYTRWPEGHEMPNLVAEYARTHFRGLHRHPLAPRIRLLPCITCKEKFESEGAHNRMCDPCRRIVYNRSGAFI